MATFSATSWASTSGLRTSKNIDDNFRLRKLFLFRFQLFDLGAFFPIITPGLGRVNIYLALLAARSISILEIPA